MSVILGRRSKCEQREAQGRARRIATTDPLIRDRAAQYRALRLPALPDRQAEVLHKLDVEGLLRNDLLVVGTNAFAQHAPVAEGAGFDPMASLPEQEWLL
jgi:hypothetical protein